MTGTENDEPVVCHPVPDHYFEQWRIAYEADPFDNFTAGIPVSGDDLSDSIYRFAACCRINGII